MTHEFTSLLKNKVRNVSYHISGTQRKGGLEALVSISRLLCPKWIKFKVLEEGQNFQTSKTSIESQAQGTNLFTRAASNQWVVQKGSRTSEGGLNPIPQGSEGQSVAKI